jgi:Trk K+ transport system NAD-binding subunit
MTTLPPGLPPSTTGFAEVDFSTWAGHVIVCGLNDVGLRILEQLHLAGEPVLVVDDGGDTRLLRIVKSLNISHMAGDPRRHSTLLDAGVKGAAALICVANHDLQNLEIALLARDMAPDLRLVVQLSNIAVGRAVARLTGPGSVLDVAALAAPSFVESCVGLSDHELVVKGHGFLVTEQTVVHAANLRTVFGDLAPIAVVPANGGDVIVCPGRDLQVHAGDRVRLIGATSDFSERRNVGATASEADPWEPARLRRWFGRSWRTARQFLVEIDRPMRLTIGSLLLVAGLSVALLLNGFRAAHDGRMTLLDAMYFTTETLTTVGFGDFYFANQPDWLRVWAILLMVGGATLVTILYAMLTNLLVTRRLAATAGRRAATGMRDHVILVGLGSVGFRVLEGLLAKRREVLVLEGDENNRYLAAARSLGVPIIICDATLPENLTAANLEHAGAVAVLTSNDLANIETGLAVDDLLNERRADVPVVLRVFDRNLASTVERGFDFHHVRSTSALAAPWFVGAALGLTILSTFYVEKMPFLVGQLTVSRTGGLNGATMSDLNARTRVIAISRHRSGGTLEYPPRRDTRFEAGDEAFVVGPYEELLQLLRHERDNSH